MNIMDIFWLFLIFASLTPALKQRILESQRITLMRRMEKKRKSRVITMIHRQEAFSFLGIGFGRFINIEDSEEILRAIRLTDPEMPIDLILHTPGGLVLAAEQIAWALADHPAKVTVFVPHYAMSGGTLLALAADEVVLDQNAVLGPVDPQLGQFAAASILKAVEQKDVNKVDDNTLIMADLARKAISQVKTTVKNILTERGVDEKRAEEMATTLSTGKWTHDYPIRVQEAREIGFTINTEMPEEIYTLMELYPQPGNRRPSVQYINIPYFHPGQPNSHDTSPRRRKA